MILSNTAILKALDAGRLVITPEPSPRAPGGEVECPYNTSSVDLRLHNEFSSPRPGRPFVVDLSRGRFADYFNAENFDTHTVPRGQVYTLEHGMFLLARTIETVEFPVKEGEIPLAARVEGRSSWARCGVLVHFTAPTIHAGFKGPITLEICNLGPASIALHPGASICQLIVEEVSGIPFRNFSQFQEQVGPGGPRKKRTK